MNKFLSLLFVTFISGCASYPTPYQEICETGGYYHQRLAKDTYKVVFRGNGFTEYRRAYDFALLRAAEICDQLGYTHFVIEGQDDKTSTTVVDLGSTSYTSGSLYGYGGSASYYGTTRTSSFLMPITRPRVELVACYFEGKPTGLYLEIFEAKSVIEKLREKYGLNLGGATKASYQSNLQIEVTHQLMPKQPDTDAKGKEIEGYKATTDPKTGKVITHPVYEDEEKK